MRDDRSDADEAIDRAVRDMLAVEPRADLRRRVLERIAEPSRRLLTFPRLAAAAAAVVMCIALPLTWWLTQRQPGPTRAPSMVQQQPVAPPASPVAAAPEAPTAKNTVATKTSFDPPERIPRGQVVAQAIAEPAESQQGLEPLQAPASLTMKGLEPPKPEVTAIALSQITVRDLARVRELQVDPIKGAVIQ
jgi:hypothetical protein